MRKHGRWVGVGLAVLLSARLFANEWPFYRHDLPGLASAGEPLAASQVPSLQQKWFSPHGIIANPVVAGGRVFITSTDGAFYALDGATGLVLWRHSALVNGPFHCFPNSTSSTQKGPVGAAAVAGSTVFAPGGDGVVYAHDAATGALRWQTKIADVPTRGEFLWSSAFPLGNRVYFGIASLHDCLLVPGRVVALDQATGQVVGTWRGDSGFGSGAGVWTQPAYDASTNRMFLTTGTIANGVTPQQQPLADAFVAIDPGTMATVDHFTPVSGNYYADVDFGASPVLYDTPDGRHWIAAANKNGWVYALNRDNLAAGVSWAYQISGYTGDPDLGGSTIVSGTFANGQLFVAGAKTTSGLSGAVAALDPATGRANWVFHPGNGDFFLGALASTGDVLLVPGTHAIPGNGTLYILSQSTGQVLWSRDTSSAMFSEPTFSDGVLYYGDLTTGIWAYQLPAAPDGGTPDAGTPDAGAPDAGMPDAGMPDAGMPDAGTPDAGTPDGGGSATLFFDDFDRTALGPSWTIAHGAFTDNGDAAMGTAAQSYMFWTGTPDASASVSAVLAPGAATYLGVVVRAQPSSPDANHYAGYIAPDGTVGIARRNAWNYTALARGPVVAPGNHVLALQASGATPVVLTVWLDGAKVLQATDASAQAFTTAGLAGLFDYSGAARPLDRFTVSSGGTPGGAGGSDGGTDAGLDGGTDGGLDGGTDGGLDGGASPGVVASDSFAGSGSLGAGWTVWSGGFSVSSGQANPTAAQSYATMSPTIGGDTTVSAIVAPNGRDYVGVIGRASNGALDHYAAWVNHDGSVHLGRRNNGTYTYLANATPGLVGAHKLELRISGIGPVHLSVLVDTNPILDLTDPGPNVLVGNGAAGLLSWQGSGPTFQSFLETQP